ncbi:hypothetical protein [Nocardia sp. NPDC057668]|uniref:hypothetical protein n=1 Tax=Nocardia sp. NPDC057668 TaxID=3346202 RepID=UPI003671B93C
MFDSPKALGFLNKDVSGVRQPWDERLIRSAAARLGYDLSKILVFDAHTQEWVHRLRVAVTRTGASAVFVPTVEHFDAAVVPTGLVAVVDVITVEPEETYARGGAGEPGHPEAPGARA